MVKERDPLENPTRCSFYPANHNKTKAKLVRTKNLFKADIAVLKRVKEMQANTGSEFPTFLTSLTRSRVADGNMVSSTTSAEMFDSIVAPESITSAEMLCSCEL